MEICGKMLTVGHRATLSTFLYASKCSYKNFEISNTVRISIYGSQYSSSRKEKRNIQFWEAQKGKENISGRDCPGKAKYIFSETGAKTENIKNQRDVCNISILERLMADIFQIHV